MESRADIGPSPPPRLNRTQAKARTRERVLAAARAVFEREGYHAATLDRIAAEAGFTKGAVYSTFDSKADVMLALVAARAERRREEMERILVETSSMRDFVAESARRTAEQIAAEREWWAVVIEFMIVVGRDERLRTRYAEHRDATREALAAALEGWARRVERRPTIPPRRLATAIMALNNGLTVEGMLAPAAVPDSLHVDAWRAIVQGALEAPAGEGERA